MGYLRMDHAHHRVSWHSILGLFDRRRAFLPNRLGPRNRDLVRVVLMRLTEWYPMSISPVRTGVYEVKVDHIEWDDSMYSYWDGKKFGWIDFYPRMAYAHRNNFSVAITTEWRGIAK